MASPKLLTALNILTKDEWSSFRKYLLMHTREDSDNFYCFTLLSERKDKLLKEGVDEKLRQKYFPKMKAKAFSNMLSRLFNWFESWFAIYLYENEKYSKELSLVKGYNQRGLFTLANQVGSKLETVIKNEAYLDINQEDSLAKLYHLQYYSSNPIKRQKGSTLFKDCIEHFLSSIAEKCAGYLLELENYSRTDYSELKNILEELIKVSPESSLRSILSLTHKVLLTKDLDVFLKLKKTLEAGSIDEASDLFLILTIYLRRSSIHIWIENKTLDPINILESHQLSFRAIEKNKHHKFLPANLFNTVSTLAAMVDYEQTENFINTWIDKVHTKNKDSVLQYCYAQNAFRHGRYEELPGLLTGLEFEFPEYKVISNALMIIAQYKLSEEDLMLTLIQNYKKQLKRNSSLVDRFLILKLNNLVDIILVLHKSKYNKNIVLDLEKHKPFFFHSWVMKEIK